MYRVSLRTTLKLIMISLCKFHTSIPLCILTLYPYLRKKSRLSSETQRVLVLWNRQKLNRPLFSLQQAKQHSKDEQARVAICRLKNLDNKLKTLVQSTINRSQVISVIRRKSAINDNILFLPETLI